MPGPPPKDPARRQRRNARPELGLVHGGRGATSSDVELPGPRRTWRKATREDFEAFRSSPLAQTLVEADFPALLRLFDLRDEQTVALAAYRRQRVVEGSMGQPRLSPYADMLARLEKLVSPLEDRFGLTPLSRLRLGITLGDAARSLDDLARLDDDPLVAVDDEDDPRVIEGDLP